MIERKLHQAMQTLPEPSSSFSQIEEKAYHSARKTTVKIGQFRRIAAILACAVLMFGSAVLAATTDVDYSAWATKSSDFLDVQRIADKLGVVLPETIDDSPFYNITTMHVVPEGTTYLEAIGTPVYRWYSVNYGVQEVIRTDHSETSITNNAYSISFGSTENELYKYVFSLDESGKRILENALPGSYRTVYYNGITIQIVTDVQYDSQNDSEIFAYHHRVIWVDTDNHAVFVFHKSLYAEEEAADQLPAEMIEFARKIIDLNIPKD